MAGQDKRGGSSAAYGAASVTYQAENKLAISIPLLLTFHKVLSSFYPIQNTLKPLCLLSTLLI